MIIDGNERVRESIGRESAFVCAPVGRSALTESTMRLENIAHRQTRRVARVRLELLLYYNTTLRAIVTKNERQIVLVLVFSKTVRFCV